MREPTTEAGRRLLQALSVGARGLILTEHILVIEAEARADCETRLATALDILDVIDGIVDDTHPEGDGCPLCTALDDLRAALAADPDEETT